MSCVSNNRHSVSQTGTHKGSERPDLSGKLALFESRQRRESLPILVNNP